MCDRSGRRILFLSNDVAYLFLFRGPLIKAFIARGYEVLAVAPPKGGEYEQHILDLGAKFEPWRIAKTGKNPFAEAKAIASLWSIFRRFRPDVFFGYTMKPVIYGMLVARLTGVARRAGMITGLGYAFTEGSGAVRRIVRGVAIIGYRIGLAKADIVILQNDEDRQTLLQLGALPKRTATALVSGSGVDIDHYEVAPPPQTEPTFLMVARLLKDKGVYEFAEAARIVRSRIPQARFILVGATDSNPSAVKQSDLNSWVSEGLIEARGHLSDPRPAYRDCHVFVLPSYREGTPRTNLEAMSMSRAIITTDVPGCRETVEHGVNGFLVPAKNVHALAQAMITLSLDLELAMRMGHAGRKICEQRFELNKVTAATMSLIEGRA